MGKKIQKKVEEKVGFHFNKLKNCYQKTSTANFRKEPHYSGLGTPTRIPLDLFSLEKNKMNITNGEITSIEPHISNLSAEYLTNSHSFEKLFYNAVDTISVEKNRQKNCSLVGINPSKTAKRKHQISSLYYQAQLMDVELYNRNSRSMSAKMNTAMKYGW